MTVVRVVVRNVLHVILDGSMSVINNKFKLVIFCTLLQFLELCSADSVLGCGGFIKSHAPIDFSKIEVKLYTKQGSLKDSTFCAPNNGYYFLPLYDKGEYYLRINPPTGWSFMPREVLLKVDGATDLCSQGKDVNFVFEGFGITGQVDNIGGGPGPKGVKITLTDKSEVRETFTNEEGTFYFTPVYPGTYVISASHPKWNFKESKHAVQVASENKELTKNTFLIIGYDVSGSIVFEKQPISKIDFLLYNDGTPQPIFDKCNKEKHPDAPFDSNYLCYVTSNDQGIFVFSQLSPGSYIVIPVYKKNNKIYHMNPQQAKFKVVRDSVVLENPFEVQRFTIFGRVLTNPNGQSIQGATVFANDKPFTTTQGDGSFTLEKITAGTYSIHIEAPGLQFSKKSVKISPTSDAHTEFFPSAFQVCGVVTSKDSHIVTFISKSNSEEFRTETTKGSGEYCTHLPPGVYTAMVSQLKADDVQFFPVSQIVQVTASPVTDVNFSQLKATVKGQVKCLKTEDCNKISVIMKHVTGDGVSKDVAYTAGLIDGQYMFSDVVTGSYQVSLGVNKFCWRSAKHTIIVNSEITIVPDFVQTGYTIVFLSSHNTQVQYQPISTAQNEPKKTVKTLQISSGQNIHCVESAGVYEFVVNSCHLYEHSTIKHNTNDESSEIILAATKHLTNVAIKSTELITNMTVTVKIGDSSNMLGPLVPENKDNMYYYKINLHLAEGEDAVLTPHAEALWFKPSTLTIKGESDCTDLGSRILGLKGRVIQGQIVPPLAGVKVTVECPGNEILIRETDPEGKFKFPTLDDSYNYKVSFSKNSYTFTGPDQNGVIKAHKLAEIIVTAVDEKDGSPLQGALISLSGGESYRSNLQTNADGIINFSSLSPSDYFLRPMMKEYNFEPSSKIISIKEGETVNIKLSGHRVAYSAYGLVTSLSGEPEDKMVVIADGVGSCSQYSEEATTEENGQFRIRGLHPQCKYQIRVKESVDPDQRIERAVPDFIPIQTNNEDIHNIKLIALRYIQHMDVVVLVQSSKAEYFKSLRLKLCKESNHNSPVYNIRLDPSMYKTTGTFQPGILVHFPPLAVDNKPYFLQLESSLSQSIHSYKTDVEYFVANSSFKYFVMNFNLQSQIQDQDIGHTSVLALPFVILCVVGIYNIQHISKFGSEFLGKYGSNVISNIFVKGKSPSVDRAVDNDEIDQLVQNINAVKRKVRPRKI